MTQRVRILIARPDHLGDVLLTLPAVVTLRRALPTAHITFLAPPGSADVARHCPAVDTTVTAPFPPLDRILSATDWSTTAGREATHLRGGFDLAILPRPHDPWSAALVAEVGVPVRFGFATPDTAPYLTHSIPEPTRCHVAMHGLLLGRATIEYLEGEDCNRPRSQAIEQRMACLNHFAQENDETYFVPTEAEEREMTMILRDIESDVSCAPVILHPGSGWPLKNWSPHNWGSLASQVYQRYRLIPIVTGSAAEREMTDMVVAYSRGKAINLAGRLSLGGLAALYKRAQIVIATDSGPLHLAAMVGTRVVGLYGPADPLIFGPWSPTERHRIVRIALACSPCGNLLDPPCGSHINPACVTGISVASVLDAIEELLGTVEGHEHNMAPRRV